jgi:hypothetical protein
MDRTVNLEENSRATVARDDRRRTHRGSAPPRRLVGARAPRHAERNQRPALQAAWRTSSRRPGRAVLVPLGAAAPVEVDEAVTLALAGENLIHREVGVSAASRF